MQERIMRCIAAAEHTLGVARGCTLLHPRHVDACGVARRQRCQ
jgi:hypothetical protein